MTTPPSPPAAPATDSATQRCPSCGASSSGRFCSSCGTALGGANCANCAASLTPGARYCHRCGTPAGSSAITTPQPGLAGSVPWVVAGIALVCLVALVVGQRFGARGAAAPEASADAAGANAPFANGAPGAPAAGMPATTDISQMSPAERADRLYKRLMRESEAGNVENVKTFMPMALASYEALAPLNLGQRYDLGRIGEVGGDIALARAQSDTILRERPSHLLGLILAANVARLEKQDAKARDLAARLLAAEPKERAAALPEYELHKGDIDAAITAARATNK